MDQTSDDAQQTERPGELLDLGQTAVQTPQRPKLPPNATAADLRRWLTQLDAKEKADKRRAEAKALRRRQDAARKRVRPARSKVVELLYAYYLVPPVEGDRSESKRIEALLGKLGLPDQAISKPAFDLIEAIKLDMHMATTKEPELGDEE